MKIYKLSILIISLLFTFLFSFCQNDKELNANDQLKIMSNKKNGMGLTVVAEDIKNINNAIKPTLTHTLVDEDYQLILKVPQKIEINHHQNRINKNIKFNIKNVSLTKQVIHPSTKLVQQIDVFPTNEIDTTILITLKRTIRYELAWKDNNTCHIVLHNVMNESSIASAPKEVLDFHSKSFSIDLHNDLAFQIFVKNASLSNNGITEVNINNIKKGKLKSCFFAIWVPNYYLSNPGMILFNKPYLKKFNQYKGKPFQFALRMIDKLIEEINTLPNMRLALSSSDLEENWNNGITSAMMGVEGAHSMGEDIDKLKTLYDKGVRYLGITWSNSNQFADAAGHNNFGGLSPLGEKLIQNMMKLGMIIDLSHCSDNTFGDIMKIVKTDYPVIASHSTARSLLNHKRNITDDMIKAIKKNGGIIGIVYHSGFLVKGKQATIEDVLDHIDYITEIASVDHVALGSDFDGFIKVPKGLEDISKLPNITIGLYNRGYSFQEIEKILGFNFLRVFKKVEEFKK